MSYGMNAFQAKQELMRLQNERVNPSRADHESEWERINVAKTAIPWPLQALRILLVIALIGLTSSEWPKNVDIKEADPYFGAQFVLIFMEIFYIALWCFPLDDKNSLFCFNMYIGLAMACKTCTIIFIIYSRICHGKLRFIIEPVIIVFIIFDAIAWKHHDKYFRAKFNLEMKKSQQKLEKITREIREMFPDENVDEIGKAAVNGYLTKVELTQCQINGTYECTSMSNVGRVKGGLRVINGKVRYFVSPEEFNAVNNKKPVIRASLSALQLENGRLREEKKDTFAIINRLQKQKGNEKLGSGTRPPVPVCAMVQASFNDFSTNVQMKDYVELDKYRTLSKEVEFMQAKLTSLAEENRLLALDSRKLKDHLHQLLAEKAKSIPEDPDLNDVD